MTKGRKKLLLILGIIVLILVGYLFCCFIIFNQIRLTALYKCQTDHSFCTQTAEIKQMQKDERLYRQPGQTGPVFGTPNESPHNENFKYPDYLGFIFSPIIYFFNYYPFADSLGAYCNFELCNSNL